MRNVENMKEQVRNYIYACEQNIKEYEKIEDKEERERAITAAKGMIADFEKVLETI